MKTERTLTLTNDELDKLAVILNAFPIEASRKLPLEVRKFHRDLFEEVTGRKLDDEPGAGKQFSQEGLRPSQIPYPPRPPTPGMEKK